MFCMFGQFTMDLTTLETPKCRVCQLLIICGLLIKSSSAQRSRKNSDTKHIVKLLNFSIMLCVNRGTTVLGLQLYLCNYIGPNSSITLSIILVSQLPFSAWISGHTNIIYFCFTHFTYLCIKFCVMELKLHVLNIQNLFC